MAFTIQFYTEEGEKAGRHGEYDTFEAADADIPAALADLPGIRPYKNYGARVEEIPPTPPPPKRKVVSRLTLRGGK